LRKGFEDFEEFEERGFPLFAPPGEFPEDFIPPPGEERFPPIPPGELQDLPFDILEQFLQGIPSAELENLEQLLRLQEEMGMPIEDFPESEPFFEGGFPPSDEFVPSGDESFIVPEGSSEPLFLNEVAPAGAIGLFLNFFLYLITGR